MKYHIHDWLCFLFFLYLELAKNIVRHSGKIQYMCTDGYKAHASYKIADYHIVGKAETCLVESFNASLRDMLARLNRRTKRFSKCTEMLRLTLVMFFNKNMTYSIYL